ncbi:dihydrofolate reductase [Aureococcus anophagefferens]|nr:dihydrofolate reductase [Aureococcus anophagefferens]
MSYFKRATTETRDPVNIVLTSDEAYALPAGVLSATSLDEGLALAEDAGVETAVIIGGARLFEETVVHPRTRVVHLTIVGRDYPPTRSSPLHGRARAQYRLESEDARADNDVAYRICVYVRNTSA